MKKGIVYKKEILAGTIWEDEEGCHFQYDKLYLANPKYGEISRTLPLREKKYISENMIPFFDGLIPEGWLLQIAVDNWKLNPRDRMNILLTLCQDNIGDVSVKKEK
ncbi:MAG: HipA N-terminal domain-containing protein [Fluviicola sp.]|nr:HipA N-terminal domain-containing protein [Fluviicola sp.]